ncbi:MAG TPA: LytTR family DNA-binding domain-containing protein [Thermoanaerobaculia bacterium]
MTITALIVDDEQLARRRIRRLLREHGGVVVAGEAASAVEAADLVLATRPDVLFLDLAMPRMSGLELLRTLSPRPEIIFTTAHSQYAVHAFDENAVDYLLKPVTRDRLARAMVRLRRALSRTASPATRSELAQLPRRIAVRNRGELLFVNVADIDWIAAEGNYCRIHTKGGSYLVRDLLAGLERRLDPAQFLRVHRSAVVNVERIRKVTGNVDEGHSLVLDDGTIVRVGGSYGEALESVLSAML